MGRVPYSTLQAEFKRILLSLGFDDQKASACATIFADNSRDGVYSHGLNRFPRFVKNITEGVVHIDAKPELESGGGFMERWNGNLAPGMLNATFCMDRAINLAREHGLGFVTIRNTNHWMRGGTYGWQAAEAGCIGICFTNAIAMMPPWGGVEPRLGNNPIIIAVPRNDGHIVLDMALSQYSGGQLENHKLNDKDLSVYGGYDKDGNLSKDPEAIVASKRLLPIGFWKGSGLAFMLDLLASILTKGSSTEEITARKVEAGVSQVFMCIHHNDTDERERIVNNILQYTKSSPIDESLGKISYPGENTLKTRLENIKDGVPVNDAIWEKIKAL